VKITDTSRDDGTVEAILVVWLRGPMKVVAALAVPARIPPPASSPAVAVTIAATAAADRRSGVMVSAPFGRECLHQ
jgi:hypothetical protein